jgi:hypothetical protein
MTLPARKMSQYTDGGVAEVFVKYHGEEDEEEGSEKSGSDFEDEIGSEEENGDSDILEPEAVLTTNG